MTKVFLGGTCAGSTWREDIIPSLQCEYFNPVVEDWNEESRNNEEIEKEQSEIRLYTITPKMEGVYSIAQAVNDSHNKNVITVFCVLTRDGNDIFGDGQLRSLEATGQIIRKNGGYFCKSLASATDYINHVTKMLDSHPRFASR